MYKDKVSTKKVKDIVLSMCDVKVSDIYFTELGAGLTTDLPVLFKHCYKYCYSDSRKL
jgi:transposase-like protein